jgi:N-acetylmuramoyl-L-alanine amidase
MIAVIARRIMEKAAVRGLCLAATLNLSEAHLVDLRGKLPTSGEYPTRDMAKVNTIIIHHTATKGQSLNSIAQFHVEQRKWQGIAYHLAVGYDGTKFLLNDVNRKTNHAQGWNTYSIGIVMIGNYDINEPSDPTITSVIEMVDIIQSQYGEMTVLFHSDTKSTACPGRFTRERLNRILVNESI